MGRLQNAPDQLFDEWWRAPAETRAAVGQQIANSGIAFETALATLERGRLYPGGAPTGVIHQHHSLDGGRLFYTLDIPERYDHTRRYPVRIHLHGGVTAREDNRPRRPDGIGMLAGRDDQIYVLPDSWVDAPWWTPVQVRNLRAIVTAVKRTYNVDDNRVSVSGVSDGGTGAFYLAMRDPTPYASYLSLNGFVMALAMRVLAIPDELYPNNLLNRPFFVVNGGRDELYPTRMVDPIMRYLEMGGVAVEYHPQATAGHDMPWWPQLRPVFESFVQRHPRAPLPEMLTWQRGDDDPFNRAHWLVVDRLTEAEEAPLAPDVNVIPTPASLRLGIRLADTSVTSVVPRSHAVALGLSRGDRVTHVNDVPTDQDVHVEDALTTCCVPGERIRIGVIRGERVLTLEGTLGSQSVFGPTVTLFPRRRKQGRVDLFKMGNTVDARTSGVAAFTLLLSPRMFDFAQPVTVRANGVTVFEGRVSPSVETLFKWAAVDDDRTALYAAELTISTRA